MIRHDKHPVAVLAAALLLPAGGGLAADHLYMTTGLGSLGGTQSAAVGMNDFGVVVGWCETAGEKPVRHAFVWEKGTPMRDLGALDEDGWSEARAINDAGVIVGVAGVGDTETRGVYWHDGVMYDLNVRLVNPIPDGPGPQPAASATRPDLGIRPIDPVLAARQPGRLKELMKTPVPSSGCFAPLRSVIEANSVNADGWIVGCGYLFADEAVHGILLIPSPVYDERDPYYDWFDLGQLPKASECIAAAVNDAGEVIGTSGDRAFFWENDRLRQLDPFTIVSGANDINERGDIAGWCGLRSDEPQACVWQDGYRWDLGCQCGVMSEAVGINPDGLVVGWAVTELEKHRHAMLWDAGVPIRLDDVAVVPVRTIVAPWDRLTEATAIDGKGRIAGYGVRDVDGTVHAFMLEPIPVTAPPKP